MQTFWSEYVAYDAACCACGMLFSCDYASMLNQQPDIIG